MQRHKPIVAVLADRELFDSFFDERLQARLDEIANWRLAAGDGAPDLRDAEGLITTWDSPLLGADLFDRAPRLRVIAHCGGEVKKRFAEELFRKLIITNAAEPMALPTAEMGVALLLASARDIVRYATVMREESNHVYDLAHTAGTTLEGLAGSEVSLIGFGRIGREIVKLTYGFDLHWSIFDPYADTSAALPNCRFVHFDEALKASRWLIIAAAATEETLNLLDAKRLKELRDGTTVVNVARGSIVDLQALTKEVLSGRLRCALDVTDPEEPLPIDHPLRKHLGAILTPHVGGGDRRVRRQMAELTIDSLERHFKGQPPLRRVTAEMLARMT